MSASSIRQTRMIKKIIYLSELTNITLPFLRFFPEEEVSSFLRSVKIILNLE